MGLERGADAGARSREGDEGRKRRGAVECGEPVKGEGGGKV